MARICPQERMVLSCKNNSGYYYEITSVDLVNQMFEIKALYPVRVREESRKYIIFDPTDLAKDKMGFSHPFEELIGNKPVFSTVATRETEDKEFPIQCEFTAEMIDIFRKYQKDDEKLGKPTTDELFCEINDNDEYMARLEQAAASQSSVILQEAFLLGELKDILEEMGKVKIASLY
jgi:hypothetical protein